MTSSDTSSDTDVQLTDVVSAAEAQHQELPPVDSEAAISGTPTGASLQESATWDLPTKRTVLVILLVATVFVLWISRSLIPLLVLSGIIAYLLNPIVDTFTRLRIPRSITTITLYLLVLVGVILAPILFAPVLLQQLTSLSFDVPSTAFRMLLWVTNAINNMPATVQFLGFEVPIDGITQEFQQNFQEFRFIPTLAEILNYFQQLISTATNVVSSTAAIGVSVVGSIVGVLFTVLIVFFLSLYLTKDAPLIRAYVEGLFPTSYQSELGDLLRRMGYIWQAFFRGQLVLSLLIGTITWAVLTVAGMPGALLLGILAGMLEIIPNLGPVLAMIPAIIIALIQGSTVLNAWGVTNFEFALITIAIYFVIQQIENNLLVPRIIGRGVNLHPIVVICGVAVGFNVAGVLGALLAAPVIASLRVLGSYVHAKLLDYEPFVGQELPPVRERRPFIYRRKVTGQELQASAAPNLLEDEQVDSTDSAPDANATDEQESTSLGASPRLA